MLESIKHTYSACREGLLFLSRVFFFFFFLKLGSDLIVETSGRIHFGMTDWTQCWEDVSGEEPGGVSEPPGGPTNKTESGSRTLGVAWISDNSLPNGSVPKEKVCGWMDGRMDAWMVSWLVGGSEPAGGLDRDGGTADG